MGVGGGGGAGAERSTYASAFPMGLLGGNRKIDDSLRHNPNAQEGALKTEEQPINELVTPREDNLLDTSDKWHYNEIV